MELMGESSSSSSKLPQSGSRRQQHPHQQLRPSESREEQRKDTKTSDGFNPENRLVTNNFVATVSPPSVVIAEDEKEHPLLYLHQSVSGTSRDGNGNRSMHESKPQPPKHPQTLQPKRNSSSNINGKGTNIDTTAHTTKGKPSMAIVTLFAIPLTLSLLLLGLPYVDSVINNTSVGDALHVMFSELCTLLSTAHLLIISLVKGLTLHTILSALPSYDTRKVAIPIEQLEQRLELGFDLLRLYDDASGSSAVCESVLHRIWDSHGGEPQDESSKGSGSSLSLLLDADENRLLSKAFRCMGEAKLALFSSSFVSQSFKKELLIQAKDNFESATAINPTEPSVRSGLGLTYLLLGMDNDESHNSQFIFQSIQHLKASVGLMDKSEHNQTDYGIAIRNAAMHNLGLAYILLDGKSSSETSDGVVATTHFIDWLTSLHSNQPAHPVTKSWPILSNKGAMLLQMGMFEDAILHLEMTNEFCREVLPSSRQQEICLIAHHNLGVARNALYEKEAPVADADDRRNDAISSSSDASSDKYATITTIEPDGKKIETHRISDEESRDSQPIIEDANTRTKSPVGPTTVKPEMQGALSALEKAATEGTQRTQLLLSLARARASTGDISGAVDATLRAVSAAHSEDEVDISTSYLDKLMEKMAGEGSEQTKRIIKEDKSSEESDESTAFVEKKDLSFFELEMKLELERLRYKVLQQEMRLGYQSNSPQSQGQFRIDYQQELNVADRGTSPKQVSEVNDEGVTMSQTAIKIADYKADDAAHIAVETTLLEDATANEVEALMSDAIASEVNLEESSESVDSQTASSDQIVSANSDIPGETHNATTSDDPITDASDDTESAAIELPPLFSPILSSPTPISPTAKSYMKMADAYLDKGMYALASKQFLKVIKKAPDHLPAYLGYATSLERAGNTKQIHTAALAYGNATKLAIVQGDKVDPLATTGAGGISENILRRAVVLAKSATNKKLETLKQLSAYGHTAAIAADIYYEIGLEIISQGIDQEDKKRDAMQAFSIANEFIASRNDTQTPYHIGSLVEIGKLALENDDAQSVIDIFNKVKHVHMEDDAHVELLVLVGRAYVILGELETAINEFTRAISFPESSSTASAHYELAATLNKSNGDTHEINLHFEKALNLGIDPTSESIDALGENNMAVVRALRRQYYRDMNAGVGSDSNTRTGGGIMSGGGVHSTSSSAFAPQSRHNEDVLTDQSETLAILEQGAASYDGHTPMGGEIEGAESSLSNLKAKKKQQGSESNLTSLRR